jgi:hypothetical protein
MSDLKFYQLRLITQGTYTATVMATSLDEAVTRARHSWSNEYPHPFKQIDEELEYVFNDEGE